MFIIISVSCNKVKKNDFEIKNSNRKTLKILHILKTKSIQNM